LKIHHQIILRIINSSKYIIYLSIYENDEIKYDPGKDNVARDSETIHSDKILSKEGINDEDLNNLF